MALMTAAAWRDDPHLRGPMIVWNAGVIVSTIPIGGHYVVDLAGGALTWFLVYRFGPSGRGCAVRGGRAPASTAARLTKRISRPHLYAYA